MQAARKLTIPATVVVVITFLAPFWLPLAVLFEPSGYLVAFVILGIDLLSLVLCQIILKSIERELPQKGNVGELCSIIFPWWKYVKSVLRRAMMGEQFSN